MKEFVVVAFYRTGRFIKTWKRVEYNVIACDVEEATYEAEQILRGAYPDNLWFIAQVIVPVIKR